MEFSNSDIVIPNLHRQKPRLADYDYLQKSLFLTDVSTSEDYQRKFNSFYRVRQRSADWYEDFYSLFEGVKYSYTSIRFKDSLLEFHGKTNRVEASFVSKIIATINPNLAVWDNQVLKNLGLKPPYYNMETNRRLERCVQTYKVLQTEMSDLLQSPSFPEWRERFDEEVPQYTHFTDMKKLDLYLWQNR